MSRTFKITHDQLNEIINSDLLFSTDTTTPYTGSKITTTEPVGDENYGKAINTE